MARMLRATIEEAALSLGVHQSVIELRIKSGTLVPCQDPSFRSCVWISGTSRPEPKGKGQHTRAGDTALVGLDGPAGEADPTAAPSSSREAGPEVPVTRPKRRARAAPKRDAPPVDLDLPGQDSPDTETGTDRDTTAVLKAEPKMGPFRPTRNTRGTPGTDAPEDGGNSFRETGLLRDTVAMLKAELENRDEQLDLLGIQLEMSRQEVRKLRPLLIRQLESGRQQVKNLDLLLASIHTAGPAPIAESPGHPAPAAVAVPDRTDRGEFPGRLVLSSVPTNPTLVAISGYVRKFGRSFRPLVGLMCLGFSLPLFH